MCYDVSDDIMEWADVHCSEWLISSPDWDRSLVSVFGLSEWQIQQELSYRKQIARQLRTQFVDGISVTLKSTLRVTQGH